MVAGTGALRDGEPGGTERSVLAARRLSVRYGDVKVLDDIDFHVAAGEAVGIVGPNGAGKTTLLSALAGTVRPAAGSISLLGTDLTQLGAERRCRLGVARAYQVPKPFGGMTVLENVLVGAAHGGQLRRRERFERAVEVVEVCGLADLANRRAETLGLLHRKRLELARALATGPSVLLLDEIGAGLTDSEADELVATILQLRQRGMSLVWIEHIVRVLVRVIDRLVAMDAGKIIADGAPDAVLRNETVMAAYLGKTRS
ncbi:ABC transporter ATP-binding protein [Frankia sp. AiPa1]|uniref:ABC transporter ATP-binding protein n=1 Tax=Frankia sp. AiPa1 TaxID=573492 RepID=UPI00202B2A09|nr:ABC transporter ATP-binding protein [Frankia sp. AiPa1]MCL9763006.1 ABC transporter ATP-binding protein [Frankia sp. AiPa1]